MKRNTLLIIILFFSFTICTTNALAQCWSIGAGAESSDTSKVRPVATDKNESILLEIEPTLQKAMGVSSKVYMIDKQAVNSNPSTGDIAFGRKYFKYLDDKFNFVIQQSGKNPIPAGIKLIIAHEYAHQFQFRMFKKKRISITSATPIDELQADTLGAYFLGSYLDSQFSKLPQKDKVAQVMDESNGAMFIVTELADPFFNDPNHHGNGNSRRIAIYQGFVMGWNNKFGTLAESMTAKEDDIYDWSRKLAEDIYKNQDNRGRTF